MQPIYALFDGREDQKSDYDRQEDGDPMPLNFG